MKAVKAPAKINLFLEITGKRDDGYHAIDTIMQTVSLCDEVLIDLNGSGVITLSCPGIDIPPEKNLAYRAAALYLGRAEIASGVDLTVNKRIPSGAGLGGGSADAAAVLRGLNGIFCAFGRDELLDMAAELGSDVPFCVLGGCARATGRGEAVKPISRGLPDCSIVIAKGVRSTSTADAYGEIDALDYDPKPDDMEELLIKGDLRGICFAAFNRFEEAVFFDREIENALTSHGALTARLSGSGSAVYGIFDDAANAEAARAGLSKKGYGAFLCRPTEA